MAHSVVFAPEAEADLLELYDYIATHGSPERALKYTERIATICERLSTFPRRGARRDEVRPGLLITSVARRVTVAYHLAGETVVIDRILYGGRDLVGMFEDE